MNLKLQIGRKTPLSVWQRFLAVWRPDFLEKLENDLDENRAWGFWFLYTTIAAVLVSIVVGVVAHFAAVDFVKNIVENIPAEARGKFQDGKLSTQNISEPIVWTEKTEDFVAVVDTIGRFETTRFDEFGNMVFVSADKIIIRQRENSGFIKTEEYLWSDFDVNFAVTGAEFSAGAEKFFGKIELVIFVVGFFVIWFFLAIFRLIFAFWWSLFAWAGGAILGIRDWTFEKSFRAVQHFMLVSLSLVFLLSVLDWQFWGSTSLIFILLFGMNFLHLKKH